jgi:hypothetical protein
MPSKTIFLPVGLIYVIFRKNAKIEFRSELPILGANQILGAKPSRPKAFYRV